MKPILLSLAGNTENQDRGLILCEGPKLVLCVADGAGGRSGGTEAAMMAVDFVSRHSLMITRAEDCAEMLRRMDAAIAKDTAAGETTCVVAILTPDEIFGASVGDSGAWLIPDAERTVELTRSQQRKPFIGSGSAWPVPFQLLKPKGNLLLATDRLLKYTSQERIIETCRQNATEAAAQRLMELVKYPSGRLPDDVTLILVKL